MTLRLGKTIILPRQEEGFFLSWQQDILGGSASLILCGTLVDGVETGIVHDH